MVILLALATREAAQADNILLEWDASASSNVAGYNVYYGTNSGNYPYMFNAGNVTSATISNLCCGTTYYFVATAYDAAGDESAYSGEICFIVPGLLTMTMHPASGGPAVLQFPVGPDHWYEIQATTDLQNWTSIWQSAVMTTNVWMQFTDANAAAFASRFYRVVTH